MNLAALGGRRFLLCVGSSAICSVLLWFGKLSDGGYVTIIMGTVAAYIAGNVTQRGIEANAETRQVVAQAQGNVTP